MAGSTNYTLKNRSDFLRLRNGHIARGPGFMLQALPNDCGILRVGYTASKKTGNAVARNRAKRRLRALVERQFSTQARMGWDYVLIAKKDATAKRPFDKLERDLLRMLDEVHDGRKPKKTSRKVPPNR